ncbi:MAG TPA: hypothetical protein VMO76_02775 [Candidatus Udaeobacter sp.]|nr:hypothetical protein [Candidatus Udaeobacter sp.]
MNEFGAWMQSNWYDLGNLLSQFAFLAAGIWFARRILKAMRESQEQFRALLKLSVVGTLPERQSSSAAGGRTFRDASPYWLTPSEAAPNLPAEVTESGPSGWAVAWHSTIQWLRAPMSSGEFAMWRRAIRWLQAPAGS